MMDDMPKKSDSKERMIAAARRLFREHGYQGTALSDVVTESAAPRGSIYFHFPGGKEELAGEVTLLHTGDHIAHINRAAAATATAGQLIEAIIGRIRDELIASNYHEGCAMAPIVIESTPASAQLSDATRRGFQDMIATLAARLTEKNIPASRATQLATLAWTSVEGALILGRVLRSPEPFDLAIALLAATADTEANDSIS
jgi:AcrR family transcriptional regulator